MGSQTCVLVVDDSPVLRASMERILHSIDCSVLQAEDGLEGLKVLRKNSNSIDLVLLDWFMPRCNGQEFLEIKRDDETIKDVPVIMVTTASEPKKMVNALRTGARHYVIKPFTEEDLIKRIQQVLRGVQEES